MLHFSSFCIFIVYNDTFLQISGISVDVGRNWRVSLLSNFFLILYHYAS